MLKVTVESLPTGTGGHRRVVASMSIAPAAPGGGGSRAVTVIEAGHGTGGGPPRMWTCTVRAPAADGRVWPVVSAAIDALAEADCVDL